MHGDKASMMFASYITAPTFFRRKRLGTWCMAMSRQWTAWYCMQVVWYIVANTSAPGWVGDMCTCVRVCVCMHDMAWPHSCHDHAWPSALMSMHIQFWWYVVKNLTLGQWPYMHARSWHAWPHMALPCMIAHWRPFFIHVHSLPWGLLSCIELKCMHVVMEWIFACILSYGSMECWYL